MLARSRSLISFSDSIFFPGKLSLLNKQEKLFLKLGMFLNFIKIFKATMQNKKYISFEPLNIKN